MSYVVGIDVGGTFTDLVAVDARGEVRIAKSLTTPADPSDGVLEGLALLAREFGLERAQLLAHTRRIVHGTTVATNALLERRGATVGLLTTEGHRDVLAMREGLKTDRYQLRVPPPPALVPRRRTHGVRERIDADGQCHVPLDSSSLERAIEALERDGVDAVAVCYLHAYRNPAHEAATRARLAARLPDAYLSISSEVLPQIKEYERTCTTAANAYVGPVLARYLRRLQTRLRDAGLSSDVLVMQSHGGVASVDDSIRLAAGSVLSGPAGGIAAARQCGRMLDEGDLVTFDMGGTSTDIALIERGEPTLSSDQEVAGVRVALPMIDIHTLGAGGGSVAHVDAAGILHVGPRSAGAEPGPACYGRGGTNATVTDANLVLGYLDPDNFLGGRQRLDVQAATRAIASIAGQLGGSLVDAAHGIVRVVDSAMADGISVVSVRRGVDPRRHTLLSFGGAAGLHAGSVARVLEMRRVVVPRIASVLSAWGMLAGDLRWELVRTCFTAADDGAAPKVRDAYAAMVHEARQRIDPALWRGAVLRHTLDMRLGEQVYEIAVTLEGAVLEAPDAMAIARARFHRRHEELYGYSAPHREPVIVNARLSVATPLAQVPVERTVVRSDAARPRGERAAWLGGWAAVPVYALDELPPGACFDGPAIVESATTTVLVRERERVEVTPQGWLAIALAESTAPAPLNPP